MCLVKVGPFKPRQCYSLLMYRSQTVAAERLNYKLNFPTHQTQLDVFRSSSLVVQLFFIFVSVRTTIPDFELRQADEKSLLTGGQIHPVEKNVVFFPQTVDATSLKAGADNSIQFTFADSTIRVTSKELTKIVDFIKLKNSV